MEYKTCIFTYYVKISYFIIGDIMCKSIPLSKLKLNKKARISYIDCNTKQKERYWNLGIIKGTLIVPIFKSPFGNPTAYEIRKSIIAIRKDNSEKIYVEPLT